MNDVLVALSPSLRRDPVSELMEWKAGAGCQESIVYKTYTGDSPKQSVTVLLHDVILAGPITSSSANVARFLASERALACLQDPNQEKCLSRLCSCVARGKSLKKVPASIEVELDTEDQQDAAEVAELLLNAEDA